MRKNELFLDTSIPKAKAPAPVETTIESLPDGTILRYVVEDSGINFPDRGVYLVPGYDYEVGDDLDGEFAARLVETNRCAIYEPGTDSQARPEDKPSPPATPEPRAVAPDGVAASNVVAAPDAQRPETVEAQIPPPPQE